MVNSDPRQSTATQIWTANSQLKSGKVNSALTKPDTALATQIQIWLRRFSFGDADIALATQIQIWRRRFRFGDADSDLATQIQLWRCKCRFGDADSYLTAQIQIWRRRFRFGKGNFTREFQLHPSTVRSNRFRIPVKKFQQTYMYILLCSNGILHLLSVSPNTHPLLLPPDKNEEQVEEGEQELFWGW
ncbi:hypothetical protein F511_14460 [Dorcoceras hygrometricum]|uniref:Uncharacterized protein n=1 Tax=Dorcoceras hygrometricum TaxID=472368 RepID=A0A2Z7AFV1_9LAMI|nr:hypothetical protein F511_14460 [Dorcoceras hygrometricum]